MIDTDINNQKRRQNQEPAAFAYDEFLNYEEYMDWINHVDENHGGLNVTVTTLGTTYENRLVPAMVIPGYREETLNNPGIVVDCGIHANEWAGPAMCRLFVHELMKCTEAENYDECDPIIRDQFYDYNWFIMPLVNPDGYSYTWSGEICHKNMS